MKIQDLLSEVTLGSYSRKAKLDQAGHAMSKAFGNDQSPEAKAMHQHKIDRREVGLGRANARHEKSKADYAQQQELQRQQAIEQDKANLPQLTKDLETLKKQFDPNFEYSDDYSFWTKQKGIQGQIARLQARIAAAQGGQSEGYHVYSRTNHDRDSSYDYNYTGHTFPDKESAMAKAQELNDSTGNYKFHTHIVRNNHPHQTGTHANVAEAKKNKKAKESTMGGTTSTASVGTGAGRKKGQGLVV